MATKRIWGGRRAGAGPPIRKATLRDGQSVQLTEDGAPSELARVTIDPRSGAVRLEWGNGKAIILYPKQRR